MTTYEELYQKLLNFSNLLKLTAKKKNVRWKIV